MTRTPIVFMSGIAREFPVAEGCISILRDVDLSIERAQYVAILGPSGSGKSTLLSCMGCLDRPTRGRYLFEGIDVVGLDDDQLASLRNRRIGFVFQAYNLLPRLTTLENVALPLFYGGQSDRDAKDAAKAALARVGLENRLDYFPNQLSGGQKQRVAIARALVSRAGLILADEPTGALDSQTADDVIASFEAVVTAGATLVLVTHNRELAARASRQIEILDGVITRDTAREAV